MKNSRLTVLWTILALGYTGQVQAAPIHIIHERPAAVMLAADAPAIISKNTIRNMPLVEVTTPQTEEVALEELSLEQLTQISVSDSKHDDQALDETVALPVRFALSLRKGQAPTRVVASLDEDLETSNGSVRNVILRLPAHSATSSASAGVGGGSSSLMVPPRRRR